VLAAVWIPLMAVSRNYLLVHWLSDVIAGAILGASVAFVVAALVRTVALRILKEPSPESAPVTG
jgi:undecaprenyl-diphosphatase